jgi:hypothetical protein
MIWIHIHGYKQILKIKIIKAFMKLKEIIKEILNNAIL